MDTFPDETKPDISGAASASASNTASPNTASAPGEDAVVRETPVYLSHALTEMLYLMQYPLRPRNEPIAPGELSEVEVKIESRVVSATLPGHSRLNVVDPSAEDYEESTPPPKGVHYTSTLVQMPTGFATLVRHDDMYTLTPLSNIVQMHPSLSHLNAAAEEAEAEAALAAAAKKEAAAAASESESRVSVTFRRPESIHARNRRHTSHSYLQKLVSDEPAIAMEVASADAPDSAAAADLELVRRSGFAAGVETAVPASALMSCVEFLPEFCPPPVLAGPRPLTTEAAARVAAAAARKSQSFVSQLQAHVPTDRLFEILVRAGVLSHRQLVTYFPDVPLGDLAVLFDGVVVYVHGVWIATSDVVETDQRTITARNYLIAAFSASEDGELLVDNLAGRLSSESPWANRLLSSLATRSTARWRLKEMPGSLPALPPALAALAESQKTALAESLDSLTHIMEASANDPDPMDGTEERHEQVHILEAIIASPAMAEDTSAIDVVINSLLEAYGVISLEGVDARVTHLRVSSAIDMAGVDRSAIHRALSQTAKYTAIPAGRTMLYVRRILPGQAKSGLIRAAVFRAVAEHGIGILRTHAIASEAVSSAELPALSERLYSRIVGEISYVPRGSQARELKTGNGNPEEAIVHTLLE